MKEKIMAMSPGEMVAKNAESMPKDQSMSEGQTEDQGAKQMGSEMNPVVGAFRTIAEFVAAKSQAGDPNAPQMQNLLAQFVSMLSGESGPATGDESMMAPPPAATEGGRGGKIGGAGPGVNPMVGTSPGTKAAKGQIPVI